MLCEFVIHNVLYTNLTKFILTHACLPGFILKHILIAKMKGDT